MTLLSKHTFRSFNTFLKTFTRPKRSCAHEATHRLCYQRSQGSHRQHVLSFNEDDEDALYHCVKCLVQVLHVEGESVVEEGDVQLSDFGFTGAVTLRVGVNCDLREETMSSEKCSIGLVLLFC